jgi:hypothetical protein
MPAPTQPRISLPPLSVSPIAPHAGAPGVRPYLLPLTSYLLPLTSGLLPLTSCLLPRVLP